MDLTWSNMIYIQESGNWMIPRLSLFDFQNYIKYYKIIWVERSFVTVFIIHFDRHKDRDVTQRIGILIKMLEIKIDIVNQQGKKTKWLCSTKLTGNPSEFIHEQRPFLSCIHANQIWDSGICRTCMHLACLMNHIEKRLEVGNGWTFEYLPLQNDQHLSS